MTLNIPPEIPSWVVAAVAGPWPKGDEDALRRLGHAWIALGEAITKISHTTGEARRRALTVLEGKTANALKQHGIDLDADLGEAAKACHSLGEQCLHDALYTEFGKYVIVGSLAALAIQLTVDLLVPGVGQVQATAATTATRLTVRAAFRDLIANLGADGARAAAARFVKVVLFKGATMGAIQGGLIPLGADVAQMMQHNRKSGDFDWEQIGLGVVAGAAAGAAGEYVGGRAMMGLERRIATDGFAGRTTVRLVGAAAGGGAGAVAAVAAIVPFTGKLELGWDHILPGIVGGALGSMPHALRGPAGPGTPAAGRGEPSNGSKSAPEPSGKQGRTPSSKNRDDQPVVTTRPESRARQAETPGAAKSAPRQEAAAQSKSAAQKGIPRQEAAPASKAPAAKSEAAPKSSVAPRQEAAPQAKAEAPQAKSAIPQQQASERPIPQQRSDGGRQVSADSAKAAPARSEAAPGAAAKPPQSSVSAPRVDPKEIPPAAVREGRADLAAAIGRLVEQHSALPEAINSAVNNGRAEVAGAIDRLIHQQAGAPEQPGGQAPHEPSANPAPRPDEPSLGETQRVRETPDAATDSNAPARVRDEPAPNEEAPPRQQIGTREPAEPQPAPATPPARLEPARQPEPTPPRQPTPGGAREPSPARPAQPREVRTPEPPNRATANRPRNNETTTPPTPRPTRETPTRPPGEVARPRNEPEAPANRRTEEAAAARRRGEAEVATRRRATEEAAARRRAEEEAAARRRAEEEAATRRRAEEEAATRRAEEAAAARARTEEEAAARRRVEEEAARRRTAEEEAATRRRAEEEAANRRRAEEEAATRRAEEEAAARRRSEEEAATRRAAEEAANRRRAEEEASRARAEEEAAAARRRAEEEAAARRTAEEAAARRRADEEAATRRRTEEEAAARRRAEEEAATRRRAEEEAATRRAEEEAAAARARTEEEAAARRTAEEAAARRRADEEAANRRRAEEAAARRRAEEEAARARAEEEAAARRRAEEEAAARRRAEEEAAARRRADDEARRTEALLERVRHESESLIKELEESRYAMREKHRDEVRRYQKAAQEALARGDWNSYSENLAKAREVLKSARETYREGDLQAKPGFSNRKLVPRLLGREQRRFTKDEYIEKWEHKLGRKITPEELRTIERGCIGVSMAGLGRENSQPPMHMAFDDPAAHAKIAAAQKALAAGEAATGKLMGATKELRRQRFALKKALEEPGATETSPEVVAAKRKVEKATELVEKYKTEAREEWRKISAEAREEHEANRNEGKIEGGERTFERVSDYTDRLNQILASKPESVAEFMAKVEADPVLSQLKGIEASLPKNGKPSEWEAVIFSKHFWSGEDGISPAPERFTPDPTTGQVDMSGKRALGRDGYINFDYGLYDKRTNSWLHANHFEPKTAEQKAVYDPMEVLQSSHKKFYSSYVDFDSAVICIAFVRKA
ncbi:hypothetical protein [Nocardia sp. NPDC056000]|uniref:WXG100-like domain-containing protein n=1 Tax=Nocardia sp. NPDC056000 TaxID=3345674 RepID=UPI0035DD72E5